MSREQERIKRKLESSPVTECNRIQKNSARNCLSSFGKQKIPGTRVIRSIATKSCLERFITRELPDWSA